MTDKEKIIEALIFIEWNLEEKMNVSLIAKEVGMPVGAFRRLFKKITGFGTENYISRRRLTEVHNQLGCGEGIDVIELSEKYHLSDNSLFIPILSMIPVKMLKILFSYFPLQESLVNYMIEQIPLKNV